MEKSEKMLQLVAQSLSVITKDIKDLKDGMKNVDKTLGHIEQDILAMKEDMGSVTGAIYSSTETLKNHERRIKTLERTRRF